MLSNTIIYATKFSDHCASDYQSILSPEEKALAEKKASKKLQDQAILSLGLRRKLLAEKLNMPAKELIFSTVANKKPILANGNLHFNVSHSGDYWVIIIDDQQVGIDIEEKNRQVEFIELAKRFFASSEVQIIEQAENPKEMFWDFWTAKEALLKASGQGIVAGLDQIQLGFDINQTLAPLTAPWNGWLLKKIKSDAKVIITAAVTNTKKLTIIDETSK